jgi:hypothetical protein
MHSLTARHRARELLRFLKLIESPRDSWRLAAAPACARVVIVDVSPVMLTPLRARVGAAQLTNVEVVQAGFLTYDHDGQPGRLHLLPVMPSTIFLTSGRPSLPRDSIGSSDQEASSACGTSPTASAARRGEQVCLARREEVRHVRSCEPRTDVEV